MIDPGLHYLDPLWKRWPSVETANAWLMLHDLQQAHNEQNEYELVHSPGYEYTTCSVGGEPTLRGRGCTDQTCGQAGCSFGYWDTEG